MFKRTSAPSVDNVELIDTLLNTEPAKRTVVIYEALESGALRGGDAAAVVRRVERLERIAGPWPAKRPPLA